MKQTLKQFFSGGGREIELLTKLLTPSWLSAVVSVIVSLVVIGGTIIDTLYRGSIFQQEITVYQSSSSPVLSTFRSISSSVSSNKLIENGLFFLFWCVVGLVAYMFVYRLMGGLKSISEFDEELHFINTKRKRLIKNTVLILVLRIVTIIVWYIFIVYSVKTILPYCLASAQLCAVNPLSLAGAGYGLLGFALLAICIQAHTNFLRLLTLRPRLLTKTESVGA